MDPKQLATEMLQAVKDYVAEAAAGISARFEAFEERLSSIPAGPKGDPGERGEKGDQGETGPAPDIEGFKSKVLENLEQAKASLNDTHAENYRVLLQKLRAEIKDGKDGEAGANGCAGKDGKDGRDGVDGKDGVGRDGKDGADGKPGQDGKSVTVEDVQPLIETMFAKAMLDYERRFGEKLASIPKPKDGVDGLSVEDLAVEHDGLGNMTLTFSRGEVCRSFSVRVPCFRDRGVYRDEIKDYRAGDGVTFGGSYWLAQRDGPEGRPGDGSTAGEKGAGNGHWRLAVNKGRDGRRDPPPPHSGPVRI